MKHFFQCYLLPGFLFQSVIIGGGYSTGRELIEFFMGAGPVAGMAGILVTMFTWSVLLALTFEFCRINRAYDYRTFFRALLGRGWVLFEILFIAIAILVLAVIGAAAGVIFAEMTGAQGFVGTAIMILGIGLLAFYGTDLIEKLVSAWSFVLYAAYITLLVVAIRSLGSEVADTLQQDTVTGPDWLNAFKYAGYNLAAAPAMIFTLAHIKERKEAIWAGIFAGPIAMTPALLFYTILLSQYPDILELEVPLLSLLAALNTTFLALVFKIVIFGTYIETGVALVHSVNERIAGLQRERGREMQHKHRIMIAAVLLFGSIYLAQTIGLIPLIARGYGTITYAILALYVLPLVTLGVMKICRT